MVLRLYRTMQYFKVSFCSVFAITVDCFYLTKSEVEVVYKILIDIYRLSTFLSKLHLFRTPPELFVYFYLNVI